MIGWACMNIGVVFPQTEFGSDPILIRDYAQAAEDLGFSHVLAYDHVLGANPDRPGGWQGTYTYRDPFFEPFLLFSFMASATHRLSFAPCVIILPQRQTALVAKQAATLDVLSRGRLRLGVGLGWNPVEYEALGEDFHTRGRRLEEQVAVLRALWTQQLVTFKGRWHTISDAGLNPMPMQRPIPLWFGGRADAALRRAARIGDGWMTNVRTPAEARPYLELLSQALEVAGRQQAGFGIEARLPYGDGSADTWDSLMRDWQALGATHLSLNTMRSGLPSPSAHIGAIRHFADAMGPLRGA